MGGHIYSSLVHGCEEGLAPPHLQVVQGVRYVFPRSIVVGPSVTELGEAVYSVLRCVFLCGWSVPEW